MFEKWLNNNDISKVSLSKRLFPPATDREYWCRVTHAYHIQNAEEYLNYEWPLMRASYFMAYHKTGNREIQENPHFARRLALVSLFLGELAEYKGRFLSDICDGIFLICEESYWGVSAHANITKNNDLLPDASDPYIDLCAAQTAELISIIYHVLYDSLYSYCPELLQRIENELDRRIIIPYLNRGDFWWMGNTTHVLNNWNPWILSNVLTVFLVCNLRKTHLELGIKKMFKEINRYYKAMPEDGGCDEGALYWTVSAAKLFAFCDLLYMASDGQINLFDDEKFRRMGQYAIKAYIGGPYFVNFSDSHLKMDIELDYELYAFGLRTGEQSFCKMASTLKRERQKNSVDTKPVNKSIKSVLFSLHYADAIDSQPEFTPYETAVLPNVQHAFMREKDWYYAAKGGHNGESHNHNDVGSYIIYHQNKPVIIDVGTCTYTRETFTSARFSMWMMRSGGHNLPIVNGFEQAVGRQYGADEFRVENKKVTTSFAGAYPKESGLLSLVRKIDVSSQGVLIEDCFGFLNDTNKIEEHFMTHLKPDITDAGIILGEKYLIKTSLPCSYEWQDFNGDKTLKHSWGTEGLYRISIFAELAKKGNFKVEVILI